MSAANPFVIDVSMATFQNDVVQKSMETPVVIDFWAPWCAPCKQLGPILEKLAAEFGGKFILAKVNTDDEPQIAQAFGVQSLPTVFGLVQGNPVDQFVGLMSEEQIRTWLAPMIPSPAQILAREAMELVETDPKDCRLK